MPSEQDPTSNTETITPIEIERKFLVNKLPDNWDDFPHEKIRQGYMVIGEDGSEARLRERDSTCTLTVKSKGDLARGEWEIPITKEQFDGLWQTTADRRIEKTRISIPYGNAMIELDLYEGNLLGLITAEVEFGSETAAVLFEPPGWFDDEITQVRAFKNQQLALNGRPEL
jgi:adenylate cyclase